MGNTKLWIKTWFVILISLVSISTTAEAQSLTWLGTLGGYQSEARDVSSDGDVVAGWAMNNSGGARAVSWIDSFIVELGGLGGGTSDAWGASEDGSVIVGWAIDFTAWERAFRWENGVMEDLGDMGGRRASAFDVSNNGNVIVGYAEDDSLIGRAVRWVNGNIEDLGTPEDFRSEALGVSKDGEVAVGWFISDSLFLREAFRWENTFLDSLGTLGGPESMAFATSFDGSVVVGWADIDDDDYHAFRWENGMMEDLGTLGEYSSLAYDVSADGSIVVGFSYDSNGNDVAFIWNDFDGMEDLNIIYDTLLAPGSELDVAYGISEDGHYIVGRGYNALSGLTEGFLLDTENSTRIDEFSSVNIPNSFALEQNYPNPFNPKTNLEFWISSASDGGLVSLKVYDVLGNEIATLVNEFKSVGVYKIVFDATNLYSGVYFAELSVGNQNKSIKMICLK